jgi:hypothetical protein
MLELHVLPRADFATTPLRPAAGSFLKRMCDLRLIFDVNSLSVDQGQWT